jgi:hypothetical protein
MGVFWVFSATSPFPESWTGEKTCAEIRPLVSRRGRLAREAPVRCASGSTTNGYDLT